MTILRSSSILFRLLLTSLNRYCIPGFFVVLMCSPFAKASNKLHFGISSAVQEETQDLPASAINAVTSNLGTRKWIYPITEESNSAPAIGSDGTIYFASKAALYAINPDGTLKWRNGSGSDYSPALADDGTVYIPVTGLAAITSTGTAKWTFTSSSNRFYTPSVAQDGTIYAGCEDSYLYAITSTGTMKWRFQTGGNTFSSPGIATDGTIYFGSRDTKIYALNPNGSQKWFYQATGQVDSSPAIGTDGTIYFTDYSGVLYALNPDGSLKWGRFIVARPIGSSPVIGPDGTIYVCFPGTADPQYPFSYTGLYLLVALTSAGNVKWSFTLDDEIHSTPTIGSDGTIYVGNFRGLNAVTADGQLKWRYSIRSDFSSPALGTDGTLYICDTFNGLHAVIAGTSLANSPWPKYKGRMTNTGRK